MDGDIIRASSEDWRRIINEMMNPNAFVPEGLTTYARSQNHNRRIFSGAGRVGAGSFPPEVSEG